jgi:RNA polymerase sigma factor (sigma-70 family)
MDLADFDGWLHRTASGMTGADGHDDLVQEGRIAMWKALERADQDAPGLAGYVTRAAKGRMIDVVTGRSTLTGHERPRQAAGTSKRGQEAREKIRAFLAHSPEASGAEIARGTGLSPATVSVQRKQLGIDTVIDEPGSLDALKDAGYDAPDHDALLDMIVQAYMYGQIRQALDVLTDNERRYVHLRFWEGYEPAELKAAFGYDPAAVWRTARERLAPVLEDLLDAA